MAGEAAKGTMGIFIVFVLSRALHPMVIDYSKVDGKMLYSKNSPAIMSQLLSMVFVNFLAWKEEGMKGVKAMSGLMMCREKPLIYAEKNPVVCVMFIFVC